MIPEDFYNKRNYLSLYNNGIPNHFPLRRAGYYAMATTPYVLKKGEDLLTIAERKFGNNNDLWIVLSDINKTQFIDDWKEGDTLQIPTQVVVESYPVGKFSEAAIPVKKFRFPTPENPFPIVVNPVCSIVSNMVLTPLTMGFKAVWDVQPSATYYIYQYKKTADSVWSSPTTVFTNTITINGDPVSYDFRVKVVCSLGGESGFVTNSVVPVSYPTCPILTSLTVVHVYGNSADFQFTDPSNATAPSVGYDVEYIKTSDINGGDFSDGFNDGFSTSVAWSQFTTSTTSFSLVGLLEDTAYTIRVRRICAYTGDTFYSNYVITTFTTMGVCGIVTNATITNFGADFADLSWTAGSSASAYTIDVITPDLQVAQTLTLSAGTNVAHIGNLLPDSDYTFSIITYCSGNRYSSEVVLHLKTLGANCPLPSIVSLTELPGLTSPLRHRIQLVVNAGSDAVSYKIFNGSGTLLLQNSLTNNIIEVEDDAWSFTSFVVGVQTICAHSTSSIVTNTLVLTQPNPSAVVCNMPGATADTVTETSFILHVATDGYTIKTLISYKKTTEDVWSAEVEHLITDTSITVTGLIAGSVYEWRIRAVCQQASEAVSYSPYKTGQLTTLGQAGGATACPLVIEVQVATVTPDSATVNWLAPDSESVVNIDSYTLKLINVSTGDASEQSVTADTLTYTFTGLLDNTDYTIQIKSICGNISQESPYNNPIPFVTTIAGGGGGGGETNP